MRSIFTFLSIIVLSLVPISTSFAQNNIQIGLPEGAIARFGKGGINVMQFSPDGTRLAVGTTIGVWLYDVKDGKEIVLPTGNVRYFNSLAFSTNGKILASGGDLNTSIQLWDTETGSKLLSIKLPSRFSRISALMFSNDNKILTSLGNNGFITQWDVDSDRDLSKQLSSYSRSVLVFAPDGKSFVSGRKDNGSIHIWDVGTGRHRAIFNQKVHPSFAKSTSKLFGDNSSEKEVWNGIQALTFSPDGKTIVSTHDDNSV